MRHATRPLLLATAVAALAACAAAEPPAFPVQPMAEEKPPEKVFEQTGKASYYGEWHQGKPTASGEKFDMNALTAAHKTLPFGTKVKVTNLENGRSVTVRITDRGPFVKGRVIDLSLAAAKKIDMVKAGVAKVEIRRVGGGDTVASTD